MKPRPVSQCTAEELLFAAFGYLPKPNKPNSETSIRTAGKLLRPIEVVGTVSGQLDFNDVFEDLKTGHKCFLRACKLYPRLFPIQRKLGAYINLDKEESAELNYFSYYKSVNDLPANVAVIHFSKDEVTGERFARVFFANKFSRKGISDIELCREKAVYEFGFVDIACDGKEHGSAIAYIGVDKNLNCRHLKYKSQTFTTVKDKHGNTEQIPQQLWIKQKFWGCVTAIKTFESFFKYVMNCHAHREMGISVYAKRKNVRVAFQMDFEVAKDIFSDRNHLYAGKSKKRIFHWVSSHYRNYSNGKITPIKTHTRGLTRFDWKGFEIAIVIPCRDGAQYSSWNVAGMQEDSPLFRKEKTKTLSAEEVATHLERVMGI